MTRAEFEALMDGLAKKATEQGLLIEVGFLSFRKYLIHANAPADQVREMRIAFFAGAQHLYGSMMGIMDPGEEPTDADMERMAKIDNELRRFAAQMHDKMMPPKGRG